MELVGALLVLVLSSALPTQSKGTEECSPDWTKLGSVCYMIKKNLRYNWHQASKFCERKGGYLAEPVNEEQDTNIKKYTMAVDFRCTHFWVGFIRQKDDKFHYQSNNETLRYTGWKRGKPDNANNQENCVEITCVGWNDNTCTRSQYFVCQRDVVVTTPSIPTTLISTWTASTTSTAPADSTYSVSLKTASIVSPTSSREVWITSPGTTNRNYLDAESKGHFPYPLISSIFILQLLVLI